MLLRSVSGVRGIIGDGLTGEIALRHAAAFGTVLCGGKVVVASDTRPTGPMIKEAAIAGLLGVGCDVIDIGIAPTPTIPLAVSRFKAAGGIAITASHNPVEWNALKFIGSATKLLLAATLDRIYQVADSDQIAAKRWNRIGQRSSSDAMQAYHIAQVLKLKPVDTRAIRACRPRVVIDAVGGAGSEYGPALLEKLGCRVHRVYCTPGPKFPRGAEPVPKNLKALGAAVRKHRAQIGFALDPDADRLAIVDETGTPLGEERTLVLATYWVLSRTPGPVVINLSTTRAVLDLARGFGQKGYSAKVGEVNVAMMMKSKRAIIGGEGNGGVIMPELHSGRDALLGIALVLSLMSNIDATISEIASELPYYHAVKKTAPRPTNIKRHLQRFDKHFAKDGHADYRDGIKVDFEESSIHVRTSNTEPIIRIASEASTRKRAQDLVREAFGVLGL